MSIENELAVAQAVERALWIQNTEGCKSWAEAKDKVTELAAKVGLDAPIIDAEGQLHEALDDLMNPSHEGDDAWSDIVSHLLGGRSWSPRVTEAICALSRYADLYRQRRWPEEFPDQGDEQEPDPEAAGCEAYHRAKDDALTEAA